MRHRGFRRVGDYPASPIVGHRRLAKVGQHGIFAALNASREMNINVTIDSFSN
jgi:hypothetical protein